MKQRLYIFAVIAISLFCFAEIKAQNNIIDEVVWVVGDEAIYKSEVEEARKDAQLRGIRWEGDPYSLIPEELAIRKLYLNQAKLDSIFVTPDEVNQQLEMRLQNMADQMGGTEKMLEYYGLSMIQLREKYYETIESEIIVSRVQSNIINKVKVTPAEVRRYIANLPEDEIPYVPTQVEVQILTIDPKIPQEEIDAVKERLREFTERIQSGETRFSTLAMLYSEDPGSARQGGECGFKGRGEFVPEFSAVAFNLTDPNKVSKIVETEYGYHIIQLKERLGDMVNVRHILLKPKVPQESIDAAMARLDSVANDIREGDFTFEDAVLYMSSDKDTRNNKGLMMYHPEMENTSISKFEMQQLPQDVAKVVSTMHVSEISDPFVMQMNNGKVTCAIVKLKTRINGHKATMVDDYQILQQIVLIDKQEKAIAEWVKEQQKTTYVKISDGWNKGGFKYPGWGER
ncbi:MAG: peptidylprolyl isomerase [Bacteroidaceae bacterium]|nr:peptidylprolyl isomerase [Bacteroidaceae bacterium]